jgi:diacylglycerol O-acyltransferase
VELPDVRIEDHVVEAPIPPDAVTETDLLRFAETLMAPVLDRARPLWRLWCITGLPDGRMGLLLAWHHALTDGMGAMRLGQALLGEADAAVAADARSSRDEAAMPGLRPSWPALVLDHARALADGIRRWRDPSARRAARQLLRAFVSGWASSRREPPTSLNEPVGPGRRSVLVRLDQAAMRRAARTHEAGLNDVVLALVAGGVRDLLVGRGEPIERLVVRAGVAVALPPSARREPGANHFGGYVVRLPIAERDPGTRTRDLAATYAAARRTQRVTGMTAIRVAAARLRATRAVLARQSRIQVMETLIPGPPHRLTLLGTRILDVIPFQPLGRNVGLTVAASTYAGRLTIVVRTDPDRFPDLDRFVAAIERDGASLPGSLVSTSPAIVPRAHGVVRLAHGDARHPRARLPTGR